MNKFTIELTGNKIKEILYQSFNEYCEEEELLKILKNDYKLMDFLINTSFGSGTLFKTCIEKNQSQWLEVIWHYEKIQEEFEEYINSLKLAIENNKLPKILLEVMQAHDVEMNIQNNKNYYSYNKPKVHKSIQWIANKMIEKVIEDSTQDNKSSHYINQYVKEIEKPLFFNLFNFFKNKNDKIEELNNIDWLMTDKKGNTIFHDLFKYDVNLYDPLLNIMNKRNYWDIKNNNGETPFELWNDEIFKNKENDLTLLKYVYQSQMSWHNKEEHLLFMLKQLIYRHAKEKDLENLQKINEVLLLMASIPEFRKSTKIKGYLNGLVNFSGNKHENINIIEKIFSHIQLQEELTYHVNSSPRNKI